ncbi:MAG: GNAT family N-acetyltransferase [Deltaproteobacteria bacterium]|nr:GNAT family N-acetyltransferase [Deltaproteobacteria bacterium]
MTEDRRDDISTGYWHDLQSQIYEKKIEELRKTYPEKFAADETVFSHINRGDRIFISTGCGEPQYLVSTLIDYVNSHPKAFFDAEVLHVWTLGVAPYTDQKFKHNFRHNSFFIGDNTRGAVNEGMADYTPIFLSEVPDLIRRGIVPIDVALIQTSLPDKHGYMSLGVSVDIDKAATEKATTVIVQTNAHMPRIHGDGFIHIDDVDFVIAHDEPLLEYDAGDDTDVIRKIGEYVARLIQDGDTIQVGYGSIPNAILANLEGKQHLGVHTELIGDGIVDLMRRGVIDNTNKTINPGKSVAAFCMGKQDTYTYLHDNPMIDFRTIDYTNDPLVIARHDNMTAINSALEIDLTGQASAESIGKIFYSGIGGQADFMRGAVLSKNGKTILALQSTASDESVSRIVPFLKEGAGATLNRGDIHYVVTEYGIIYLHGKNIRERAMDLIAIAHPKFRPWLIEEAKKAGLIYKDQSFIPGKRGEYPENLEGYRTTKTGVDIYLRPVKISDEPLLKDFFYSLSDKSMYRRFISQRKDMPHEILQHFAVIDYTREMTVLAVTGRRFRETVVGMGQYRTGESSHTADIAFAIRDDYQNKGIGTELILYLTYLAKRGGLLGFTADVLVDNKPMLRVFEKTGFEIQRKPSYGVYELEMSFKDNTK